MSLAARLLWIILAALVAIRAALAFVPSMSAWGLNVLRFVPPRAGWVLWSLAAFALIPAVARRAEPWASRVFANGARSALGRYVPWVAAGMAVAALLPDRLFFVGDFLLRETSSHVPTSIFRTLYPQGLPLDALLHDDVVRGLSRVFGVDAYRVGRLIGIAEAGLMGVLAARFADVMNLDGPAALASSALVLCGGYLALFAGYDKCFAEIVLVTAAVGVFGLEAVRRGSGLLPLGLALGAGLLLHRLAIGLLPAWLIVWVMWLRVHDRRELLRSPKTIAAALIPLIAFAVMAPRLGHIVMSVDTGNFLPGRAWSPAGVLAAALSWAQLRELANVILVMSPLAPIAALIVFVAPTSGRRRELWVLGALLLPLVAFAPFYHPPQGIFRDCDGFAATGVALSLVAAWVIGEILREPARFRWLALAVAFGAFAPVGQWMLHQTDTELGFSQIEAFLHEPPARPEADRASAWDFLGMRYIELERPYKSADAFAAAAAITPSPKILRAWAMVEMGLGDSDQARGIYRRLLARAPGDARAWLEYATLSAQVGDSAEVRRAAEQTLRITPGDPRAMEFLEALDSILEGP